MKKMKGKALAIIVCMIFILSACTRIQSENEDATSIAEDFSNEYLVNFPDVKNIVNYLEIEIANVNKLSETNNEILFCFTADLFDEDAESINNFVRQLEQEEYEVEIYDATISSTCELIKGDILFQITSISSIEDWKELHKDDLELSKMNNENTVCEVSLIDQTIK